MDRILSIIGEPEPEPEPQEETPVPCEEQNEHQNQNPENENQGEAAAIEAEIERKSEKHRNVVTAKVTRLMKTLATICQDLKYYGLEVGAFVMEQGATLTCGSPVMRNVVQHPEWMRILHNVAEKTSHSDHVRDRWEVTPVGIKIVTPAKNQKNNNNSNQQYGMMETDSEMHASQGEKHGLQTPGSQQPGNSGQDEDDAVAVTGFSLDACLSPDMGSVARLKAMAHKGFLSADNEGGSQSMDETQRIKTEECSSDSVQDRSEKCLPWNNGEDHHEADNRGAMQHLREMPYKCRSCSAIFPTLSSFVLHDRTQKGECSIFPDKILNLGARKKKNKKRKVKTPAADKPGGANTDPARYRNFGCSECGARFVTMELLTQHSHVAHFLELPYPCRLCDLRFKLPKARDNHESKHKSDKPYNCHICGHQLETVEELIVHKWADGCVQLYTPRSRGKGRGRPRVRPIKPIELDGDRPFSCDVCFKGFKKKAHLKAHMRLHTGEKPFHCNLCGATFTQLGGLTLHKKSRHQITSSNKKDSDTNRGGARDGMSGGLEPVDHPSNFGDNFELIEVDSNHGEVAALMTGGPVGHDQSGGQPAVHFAGQQGGQYAGHQGAQFPGQPGAPYAGGQPGGHYNAQSGAQFANQQGAQQGAQWNEGMTTDGRDDFVDPRPRKFGCDYCGKRFFTTTHLKQHVRIHTGERPFKCDVCNLTFTQSTSLTIHKRKHTGERPYPCHICGYNFYCSSDLLSHKRKRHGLERIPTSKDQPDKYLCNICGMVFPDTSRLQMHKRKHSGEKPFACDQCDRRFTEKHNLLRHKQRHLGLKAYQCDICGAKFTEKGNLKVHMRYHTGEKPFKCEFCGEGFFVTSTLKIHRRKHTGERPFLCDLCGASFTQGSKLRSHRRQHTGEKPYKCNYCGERFKEKHQLTVHERKHTGEQPYRCSICGKVTQKASHLAVHMRLHTGERPYHCHVCGDKFARSDVLKMHMKKHTPASSAGPTPVVSVTATDMTMRAATDMSMRTATDMSMRTATDMSMRAAADMSLRAAADMSLPAMVTSNLIPPTMVPTPSMMPTSYHPIHM